MTVKCIAQNTVGANEITEDLEAVLQIHYAQQLDQSDFGWKLTIVIVLVALVLIVIVGLFCLFKMSSKKDNVYEDPQENEMLHDERLAQGSLPPTIVKASVRDTTVEDDRVLRDHLNMQESAGQLPEKFEPADLVFEGAEPPQSDQELLKICML